MTANSEMIAYWNDVAGDKWVRDQAALDRLMAPLEDALVEAAAPAPGEGVLDVGCGCGSLAARVAGLVGREGHVTGVDVSRPMLAQARRSAGDGARMDWIEADAAIHPFEPRFDLMVSRFGVMFFADPAAAFANLRRALKPAGRFALLAWRGRTEVEWMQAPLDWLAPLLPRPEPSDGRPGPFGLADADATRATLEWAGFGQVRAEKLDGPVLIGRDAEDALAMLLRSGPAAAAIREAPEAMRPGAERLLREGLQAYVGSDGAVRMGAACWVYQGQV